MKQVSIYKNFNEVLEDKPIPLILEDIRTGKYKNQIIYLRKSLADNKMEAYEKAKKALPAFTPSGKFVGGRKAELLAEYSQFIILDIDKLSKEDLVNATVTANSCEFTFASFISPSGNGLKILVQINSSKALHKDAFLVVQKHYEKLLNLPIDKSGKDITRLCFFSFDEKLFHNPNSSIFQVISNEIIIPQNEQTNTNFNSQQSITDYSVVYQHCIKFTEKKVQYMNGSRNVFVHQLACNLNRKAVPFQAALGYILADYNFDEKEVTQAVNSAYGNVLEYGKSNQNNNAKSNTIITEDGELIIQPTQKENKNNNNDEDDEDKPKPTVIDKLENFLSNKYIFRHNIVSGKLEFQYFGKKKWNVMNDFIENSMLRECLKARIKTNLSSLRNLLYSDFCQLYNPFENYFYELPKYDDTKDYITELANTITTTKQDLWQQCFKKWLVAMVGCVLDPKVINHTVIVFSGKQGLGKTTWVEKLIPKQLKEYLFSGTINPNNKDTLVHLAECMLINLDELENLNRSEIGSLKEIITKTQIRMRKAYGHNNETMPRRASFAGSVNTAQFLNDSTGSRRFLCFEVEGIKYQHDIDINLVFAQALHLFNSDFRYWFDQEEIKAISDNNEQYQLRSPEEELLLTWFEPATKENANTFLNASQIASKLAEKAKITLTDATINKLGKALKKHHFIRISKKTGYVYAVNEFTWEQVEQRNKNNEPTPPIPNTPEQSNLPF